MYVGSRIARGVSLRNGGVSAAISTRLLLVLSARIVVILRAAGLPYTYILCNTMKLLHLPVEIYAEFVGFVDSFIIDFSSSSMILPS